MVTVFDRGGIPRPCPLLEHEIFVVQRGNLVPWPVSDAGFNRAWLRALGGSAEGDAAFEHGLCRRRGDAGRHASKIHPTNVCRRHIASIGARASQNQGVILVLVDPIVAESDVEEPGAWVTARIAPIEELNRVAGAVSVLFKTDFHFGVGAVSRILDAALEAHAVSSQQEAAVLM